MSTEPDTAPVLTPRQRLDAAAIAYHDARLAIIYYGWTAERANARDTAHRERQAALTDIITEHVRWVLEGSVGANLTGADLTDANLTGADLTGANLTRADLTRANLTDANLTGADLTRANLTRADLTRANLTRADLTGADLTGADLTTIWRDVDAVLASALQEVPFLLTSLREGRVDGSTYDGECACLVGTLENGARIASHAISVPRDPYRPAERWFMGIRRGDTPTNSTVCAVTAKHVEQWLASQPAPTQES